MTTSRPSCSSMEAARHICEEARVVLTSLRGGPPAVARGELSQDLMELRAIVKAHLDQVPTTPATTTTSSLDGTAGPPRPATPMEQAPTEGDPNTSVEDEEDGVLVQRPVPESPMPQSKFCNFSSPPRGSNMMMDPFAPGTPQGGEDVGPFARPFLNVVMDPRAAGPHTLVALRCLFRLLERGSFCSASYPVALEPLMRGVLACKFEQTDVGADEAVEMAIADLLALLASVDPAAFRPTTLMEAFNTVFVTRNTFVHSPALCYHFEDVLTSIVKSVFGDANRNQTAAKLMLEFLVNQLLHTPLTGGEALDESSREAQMAHDATRVLCLRLTRSCLQTGWPVGAALSGSANATPANMPPVPSLDPVSEGQQQQPRPGAHHDRSLIRIIQDDLCLSLLMTGQAIWAYAPGFVSIEVLSEICATLSTLWNTPSLRQHLICQFETIYTGFFQRALVLLRKRPNPTDSVMFNENLVFDSEVEIILESLVDLLCMHEVAPGSAASKTESCLEALYATYDCHLGRSDVSEGLMVELCRCCGAIVDGEGNAVLVPSAPPAVSSPENPQPSVFRAVPPYIKELCAEALLGGMKCLFKDDDVSEEVLAERAKRRNELMDGPQELEMMAPIDQEGRSASVTHTAEDAGSLSHRTIKSKKRLMCRAAKLFNEKDSKGIDFLVKSGLIPEPVTPRSVATFLRNGLVVGLDKAAVGQYLGNIGKPAIAGKSPPSWERDWFHKECLETYCSLFKFEGQSLLDGLRMFLAAFRLPGESQQIDRIIQAFADSCGKVCDENVRLKIFSEDPKRASDAAFLLSFSIIMLNTDRHNPHIREDKKMSVEAFIRNNTDYGRDITEKGKEFPPDFLVTVYDSINEEEIRTEGEGSEGAMTVERWRDVIRLTDDSAALISTPKNLDSGDLKELVVENLWMPMLSSIGAFWGYVHAEDTNAEAAAEGSPSGMLGAQGARLGMDIALEMLTGVRNIGRVDLFREIFVCICGYTGLIGDYRADAVQRTSAFVNSVEAQSAVIVALQAASDAGDEIGIDGWKRLLGVVFELRDLMLLGGGNSTQRHGILSESESDLLLEQARREWSIRLVKGDYVPGGDNAGGNPTGFLGVMGRALFGSVEDIPDQVQAEEQAEQEHAPVRTTHGKEDLVIWNEMAASDDEDDEKEEEDVSYSYDKPGAMANRFASAGTNFESQLIHEDMLIHHQTDMPVTGLERVDDSLPFQISPRARVRKRLMMSCDFAGLISQSRLLDLAGVKNLVGALVEVIDDAASGYDGSEELREEDPFKFPLSPASEAFAEVLLSEVAIRNRDRLGFLWQSTLKDHYQKRLASFLTHEPESANPSKLVMRPGAEKCVGGLLRVAACAVQRDDVADEVLSSLSMLYSLREGSELSLEGFERHLGEGLWRICRNVDGLAKLESEGWEGLLGLAEWCAGRGGVVNIADKNGAGLAEDDPSLQAYRSLHLIYHAPELQSSTPFASRRAVRALIIAGERGHCSKLCLAGLDLLHELHTRLHHNAEHNPSSMLEPISEFWIPVVETIAEAAEHSSDPGVRQHALSILTDVFLDKYGSTLSPRILATALTKVCVPLAGKRIAVLLLDESRMISFTEEIMIEFEQCTSLIYKPFLNHTKNLQSSPDDLAAVWNAILGVMKQLLSEPVEVEPGNEMTPSRLKKTLKELASEHLRNAIMVLKAAGVVASDAESTDDLSQVTWSAVDQMGFCTELSAEWKATGSAAGTGETKTSN